MAGRWWTAHLVQQVVYLDQSKYQLCLVAQPQCPLFLQELAWQQKEAPLFEQQSHFAFILFEMAASMPWNSPLLSRQTSLHQSRHSRWPQYLPTSGPQSGPEDLLSLAQRMLCLQKQHLTSSFSPLNGALLGLFTSKYRLISSSSTDQTDPSESNSMGACFSLLFLLLSSPKTTTRSWSVSTSRSTMSPTMNLQFLGWWMGIQRAALAQKLVMRSWMLARPAALYLQSCRIFLRMRSQSNSSWAQACLSSWNCSESSPGKETAMRRQCGHACINSNLNNGSHSYTSNHSTAAPYFPSTLAPVQLLQYGQVYVDEAREGEQPGRQQPVRVLHLPRGGRPEGPHHQGAQGRPRGPQEERRRVLQAPRAVQAPPAQVQAPQRRKGQRRPRLQDEALGRSQEHRTAQERDRRAQGRTQGQEAGDRGPGERLQCAPAAAGREEHRAGELQERLQGQHGRQRGAGGGAGEPGQRGGEAAGDHRAGAGGGPAAEGGQRERGEAGGGAGEVPGAAGAAGAHPPREDPGLREREQRAGRQHQRALRQPQRARGRHQEGPGRAARPAAAHLRGRAAQREAQGREPARPARHPGRDPQEQQPPQEPQERRVHQQGARRADRGGREGGGRPQGGAELARPHQREARRGPGGLPRAPREHRPHKHQAGGAPAELLQRGRVGARPHQPQAQGRGLQEQGQRGPEELLLLPRRQVRLRDPRRQQQPPRVPLILLPNNPTLTVLLILASSLHYCLLNGQQCSGALLQQFILALTIIIAMDEVVEIDGSLYEGGGQMIRSSLALSLLLNKEFTMVGIRKNRPNPGINNQLRSVFSAFVEKVPKVGDLEVYFYPKFLQPKEILASSAASCTLMMQCLVPVFTGLGYDQEVKINGGTDVSRSPPLESIRLGLIPLLSKMGVDLQIVDVKPGYYPVGKGHITIRVSKCAGIRPIKVTELGRPERAVITYYVKDTKPPASSKDFRKDVKKVLAQAFGEECKVEVEVKHQKVFNTKDEYGIGCMVLGQNLLWDVGTVGERVKEEDILARLEHYAAKKCSFDEHHQDQLLLYMALAEGTSELLVGEELSLHTQSLIYIIQKFLPDVAVAHEQGVIRVTGIGYKPK